MRMCVLGWGIGALRWAPPIPCPRRERGKSAALAAVDLVAVWGRASVALVDTDAVLEKLAVCAHLAGRARRAVVAHPTVIATHCAGTLACAALLVDPVVACEGSATLTAVVARVVLYQAGGVTVGVASVVALPEVLPAQAEPAGCGLRANF